MTADGRVGVPSGTRRLGEDGSRDCRMEMARARGGNREFGECRQGIGEGCRQGGSVRGMSPAVRKNGERDRVQ